jgi:hypothetical protein
MRRRKNGTRAQLRAINERRGVMHSIELGEGEDSKKLFLIMVICSFQGKAPDNLEGARRLAKLQDAIESHATVEVIGNTTRYELREDKKTLTLSDGPYEMLKSRFFEAGISWSPQDNRRMLRAYDAVCNAREVKAEEISTGS